MSRPPTARAVPDTLDITAYQGDTFTLVLDLTAEGQPIDLTGTAFRLQVRESVADDAPAVVLDVPMTIDATAGRVTGEVDPATLAGMAGTYRYDIEWQHDSRVRTLVAGRFIVMQEVTR